MEIIILAFAVLGGIVFFIFMIDQVMRHIENVRCEKFLDELDELNKSKPKRGSDPTL